MAGGFQFNSNNAGILYRKIYIDHQALNQIGSTEVALATPPQGKIIVPHHIFAVYTFGTVPYNSACGFIYCYNGNINAAAWGADVTPQWSGNTFNQVLFPQPANGAALEFDTSLLAGLPFTAKGSAAFGAGDGTVTIHFYYSVLTV